jgi:monoamine oxidase
MVIIIGAGLSGLVTAYRLKQAKIPFKILEAKAKIGGRIFTKITEDQTPIEMGATWFGKQHQNLIKLLNELELGAFPQFQGEYYFYDDPGSSHHGKYKLPQQDRSYRIAGGSKSLLEKIFEKLDEEDILFNVHVNAIERGSENLIITTRNDEQHIADQVVLAIPPKIWAHQISFEPSLPQELEHVAKNTQTWMEDSIKAAVEFETPFWRNNHNPSTIISNLGPFIECYDHSNQQENKFALCGFLSPEFKNMKGKKRERLVLEQLAGIFGEGALNAISYQEYIWSEDDYVKWPKDIFMQAHQNNGHPIFRKSFFDHSLIISSTESAKSFPGYMDGAIEAGENAFKMVNENLKKIKFQM